MNDTTEAFTTDTLRSDDWTPWQPARSTGKRKTLPFSPDENIELWLEHNAPLTFQQLADIRYSLYHHCSRADFSVTNVLDDEFDLIGRHSTLRVISNNARKYLLWRLRVLGKTKNWIGAIPRTRNPRK